MNRSIVLTFEFLHGVRRLELFKNSGNSNRGERKKERREETKSETNWEKKKYVDFSYVDRLRRFDVSGKYCSWPCEGSTLTSNRD